MNGLEQNDLIVQQIMQFAKRILEMILKKESYSEEEMQQIVSEATGLNFEFLATLSDQAVYSLLVLQQDSSQVLTAALAFHKLGRAKLALRLLQEVKRRPMLKEMAGIWQESYDAIQTVIDAAEHRQPD